MAKIQCEYCGFFIEEDAEQCSNCGAVNENCKRFISETPKTIEELRSWYIARKLPPEEITRFFIGKDIKEPKAFGIYEKNGKFIVYKNKANGQRVIRYEGKDEEYAVNELYLRLKEEILKQKTTNLNRRQSQNSANEANKYSRYTYNSNRYNRPQKHRNNSVSLVWVVYILVMVMVFGGVGSVLLKNIDVFLPGHYSYYYLDNNDHVYYRQDDDKGDDTWWKFNEDEKEWVVYKVFEDGEFPDGIIPETENSDVYSIASQLNLNAEELNIHYSKNFIDAGNHRKPSSAYYYYNNKLYYYLDDVHSNYGSSDNTGWYIYENDEWDYYCSTDDKEKLGDELWYADRNYNVGTDIDNIYDYDDELSQSWNPSSFEDTSWYHSYESNNEAYERHQEEIRDNNNDSDWDSDSDYDWDDNDDWDSDDTDWDSDW